MKKISIIIPVYNTEQYLDKCLNSLVNQTLKEIEIIFVDDGSSDNSYKIICDYAQKDNRIKVLKQKHALQGAARNAGMRVATGEYIGFVDSDDWINLDYFEKLYKTAKKYDSDIALATNIRIGNGKTKKRLNIKEEKFVTSLQDKIDIGNQAKNPCPTNKIYRRTMLESNNIAWKEGCYCEDKLFTIQAIYYANGIVSVPDVNYYYFRNPKSTVNTKSRKLTKDKNRARKEVLNFLKEKNAQIKDCEFWAIERELSLCAIPVYQIKTSLNTKKILIAGIKIAEYQTDYKHCKINVLGIKIKCKNKNWLEFSNQYNKEKGLINLGLCKPNGYKNILFVASYFVKIGGIETRLMQYIKMLEKYGWNVYLLSENNENKQLKEKYNFYLNFDAENFNECLNEIIEKYNISVIEFQFKNSKILKKLDINRLKTKARLGCTIHNIGVKNISYINQLDYSVIVSNYLHQNHYSHIKNAIVIQNSIEVTNNKKYWQYTNQDSALLVSRISKDKIKSIECFIKYCQLHKINFQIAGCEGAPNSLIPKLKKKYKLQDDVFIGAINTREYLEQNLNNILFVGGVGLVMLESGILGIPSFCCSDWQGKKYSFITKDNIALFDNFTIRRESPVTKKCKKTYKLELEDLNKYSLREYIKQYRNLELMAEKYLKILTETQYKEKE